MIPDSWREGEVAVIGLGRTGIAVAQFMKDAGYRVYASDPRESGNVLESAQSLTSLGVEVEVGNHDLPRIAKAALVVPSPGVPPESPPLKAALDANCTVLAELDVALLFLRDVPSIIVSGTNGKSTTTALITHLLNTAGCDAVAAGNIGLPLIEIAARLRRPQWIVVEASSYQLHFSPHLCPRIGVLTNVTPDHIGWHGDVRAYYAAKQKLFANAAADSVWVLNADDSTVGDLSLGVAGNRLSWSLSSVADAWYDRTRGSLVLHDAPLIWRGDYPLLGDHNVSNALAASLAVGATGATPETIAAGLESFQSLSHRLEPVREVDGVLWINDSKATNVSSLDVAVRAMTRPFVLLMGGQGKGETYSALGQVLGDGCHDIVAYGDEMMVIADQLGDIVPVHTDAVFDAAMRRARSLAVPGDAVLLSPACASFDQFSDFEERGRAFREFVEAL